MGLGRLKKVIESYFFSYMLLLFLCGLAVLAGLAYYQLKQIYIQDSFSVLKNTQDLVKNGMIHYVQDQKETAHEIAENKEVVDFIVTHATRGISMEGMGSVEKKTTGQRLKEAVAKKVSNRFFMLFSLRKELLFNSGSSFTSFSDETFQNLLENSFILFDPVISDFISDAQTHQHHIFVAASVMHEKQLIGYFVLELNPADLYEVVKRGYTRIGKSGDIAIAEKKGEDAVIVMPTRANPNAAFTMIVPLGSPNSIGLQESVRGEGGSLVGKDFYNKLALFTWDYIPDIRWGIVVQQTMKEIGQLLGGVFRAFLIFLMLCLIGIGACLYRFLSNTDSRHYLLNMLLRTVAFVTYLFFIVQIIYLVLFVYHSYQRVHMEQKQRETQISVALQNAAQRVDYIFYHLEEMAQFIARRISSNGFTRDDFAEHVKTVLTQNAHAQSMSVVVKIVHTQLGENKNWQVTSFAKNKQGSVESYRSTSDVDWISRVIKRHSGWELPYNDDQRECVYTLLVYDKTGAEVIAFVEISCLKEMILHELDDALSGEISFCLIASDGKVIYKQKGIPIESFEVNPQLPHSSLRFAKISRILWYVGGKSERRSAYWSFIMPFLLGLMRSLLAIGVITCAFSYGYNALHREKPQRRRTLFVLLVAIAVNIFLMMW